MKGFTHFTNNKYAVCYIIFLCRQTKDNENEEQKITKPPKLFTNNLCYTLISFFNPNF